MSLNSPELLFALIGLVVLFALTYLAAGFIVLLMITRDERTDRLTYRWPAYRVLAAWAVWPITSVWMLWRVR